MKFISKNLIDIKKSPEAFIAHGDILMAQLKASDAIVNYRKALNIKNEPITNVHIANIYLAARNL